MLAGCTAQPDYTDLERPRTSDDTFPADVPADANGAIIPDSLRLIGTTNGMTVYAAMAAETDGRCVIAVRSDNVNWASACGTSTADKPSLSFDGTNFTITRDDTDLGPEWRALSKNVWTS